MEEKSALTRWICLAIGVIVLLFDGIIYAWSILKVPLAAEFGWTIDELAINYTLTMSFFCLGGIAGGHFFQKNRYKIFIINIIHYGLYRFYAYSIFIRTEYRDAIFFI